MDHIAQFLETQNKDGSWDNHSSYPHRGAYHGGTRGYWGKEGATAMAILNLQVYFRYGSVHEMYERYGKITAQTGIKKQKVFSSKADEKEIILDFL